MRNVRQTAERIHMEILWVKGSANINTKLTIYYECILTKVEDTYASGCRSREFELNVLSKKVKNVETKSWQVSLRKGGSLTYNAPPGSQHSMSFCEKENQKTQLQNINIWKPGRFLRASDLTSISNPAFNIVNVYLQPSLNVFKKTFLRLICRP